MTGGKLLTERRGGVLVLTLNRPEVRNAIDTETAWAVSHALDELEADVTLAAARADRGGRHVLRGHGPQGVPRRGEAIGRGRGFAGIVERPPEKPVIAAVEGTAIAGGFEIVLACDLVVAADDARFGLPEVRRGLVAAGGGLLRLSRRVPFHLAMEWALTGDFVPPRRPSGRPGESPGAARHRAHGRRRARGGHSPQRPARGGCHQAHPHRVPGLAAGRGVRPAAGDQRAGARVGRRARGGAGVQGETHPAVDQHMSGAAIERNLISGPKAEE